MGHVEVAHVEYYLPDGRMLLNDVSFRVGEGNVAALVGPNGVGKTTLLRLISGDLKPHAGQVSISGNVIGGVLDALFSKKFLCHLAKVTGRSRVNSYGLFHKVKSLSSILTVYHMRQASDALLCTAYLPHK